MTFNDIASRNFKANAGKYIPFFLCSSFSIMVFFMYSALLFNRALLKPRDDNGFTAVVFLIGMVSIALFSFFFMNYAHSSFIKSRHKEFGVYMALGMSPSDIRRLVLLGNVFIILSSFFAGLLSGVIFSRIFQMIVLKLLNMEGTAFNLGYECFAVTAAVFAAILMSVAGISRYELRTLDISEMFKKAAQREAGSGSGLFQGITGVAAILLSFACLHLFANYEQLKTSPVAIAIYLFLNLSGVHFAIAGVGRLIIRLFNKNKRLYYKNLLTITEISAKFNRQKNFIFALSLLSSMIIFLVASPLSLLGLYESVAGISQPHHLEYLELGKINAIPRKAAEGILEQAAIPVVREGSADFLSLYIREGTDKYDLLHSKPVVAQSTYNALCNAELSVPRGRAANIIIAWEPGYHGIEPSETIRLQAGAAVFEFTVEASLHAAWFTGGSVYPCSSGIVLNDEDYRVLEQASPSDYRGIYHIYDFEDWKKTGPAVSLLKRELKKSNDMLGPGDREKSAYFKAISRLEISEGLKHGYSMFIFITVVVGILFFIAAGSVVYFRLYADRDAAVEKYLRLYMLGISGSEIAAAISKELGLIFFTPLIFGAIPGFSFVCFMTDWAGGASLVGKVILYAAIAAAVYFLFQAAFYAVVKRRFTAEILDSLEARVS